MQSIFFDGKVQLKSENFNPVKIRSKSLEIISKQGVLARFLAGRIDSSRIFIFGPPDFSADFVAGFFLLIFVGKSAQKILQEKSPAKSSKIYATKIPDTFLQRGRANKSLWYNKSISIPNTFLQIGQANKSHYKPCYNTCVTHGLL